MGGEARAAGRLLLVAWVLAGGVASAAAKKDDRADLDAGKPGGLWVRLPTPDERDEVWRAKTGGAAGRGVVRCAIGDQGELHDCRVVSETPVGSGWGAAALALVPKYQRKPPGDKDLREINIVQAWYPMDKAPDWLRKPTSSELLAVFPTEAYKRGQSGRAVISCLNTVQGRLADCVVVDESPAGAGFGGAAVALTPQFLMKPAELGGKPVVSTLNMPINFITAGKPGPDTVSKRVLPPNVAWSEAPSYSEVAAAYPAKARAEHRGGRVTLACEMTEQGRLKACDTATVEPKGYGFETAAKQLARGFGLAVRTDQDRKATHELIVHLPVTFDAGMLDQATPVVGKPNWATIPSAEQLRGAFATVKAAGVSRAQLTCVVQAGGALANCAVVSEDPAGSGVGAAALSLAPVFRLSTWTVEGLPVVGGAVRIPLRYEGGAAAPASQQPASAP